MATYRDYGTLNYEQETNQATDTVKYGQVYRATHTGEGLYLPLMNRSFISFSFGKKPIEDFDLLATIENNRLEGNLYAPFTDNTTSYKNLDGQQYWSTHYTSPTFTFNLATDGITERLLDEFKYWFKAGVTRELVLAEHPNRAILARVSEPPQMHLLPFEQPVQVETNSNLVYTTSTTLYKGEIVLKLIADEPHWYALDNILGIKEDQGGFVRYIDEWINPNGVREQIFASKDALKILYEDGIPLGSTIDENMLLGNGGLAKIKDNILSFIYNEVERKGAKIDPGDRTMGMIAGALIDANGTGIEELPAGVEAYFFYAGTAPAYTRIEFELTPEVDSEHRIITPYNSLASTAVAYNTITIRSRTEQKLQFTTPNLYTSYNTVFKIVATQKTLNGTWEDLFMALREDVHHPAVREWASLVFTYEKLHGSTVAAIELDHLGTLMEYFLKSNTSTLYPAKFSFNSETGEAIGTFQYRIPTGLMPENDDAWETYGISSNIKTEDVGDMLRSNYIIIRDRNYATSTGRIVGWTAESPTNSHAIIHDVTTPLRQIQILYKNMYL